jgi:cyclopropane-fatty-acyl-phospholipid synthase
MENIDIKTMGLDIDLVISSHTLEHIEEPKKMIKNMLAFGSNETLYVFQFPGLETLVNQCHFDQVFHQHLNYFSLRSVIYMLDDLDAELVDYEVNPYHWGAIMIALRKRRSTSRSNNKYFNTDAQKITRQYVLNQYLVFKQNMGISSQRLFSSGNKTIYGYGAALMLPVLSYYIKGLDKISCIIDEDPDKNGLYYLNFPVKIQLPEKIKNIMDATVIVTAINSMQAVRAIVNKLVKMNVRQIILPTNLI